jgi:chromosome segregation ATPase
MYNVEERLEWAEEQGASAEGDIMREANYVERQQRNHQQYQHQQPSPPSTPPKNPILQLQQQRLESSATINHRHNHHRHFENNNHHNSDNNVRSTSSNNHNTNTNHDKMISMSENQIQELIENRIQQNENETIITLKKQLDELKFFQELEKDQQWNEDQNVMINNKSVSSSPPPPPQESLQQIEQLQTQLRAAQSTVNTLNTENASINTQLVELREETIDLQAKLQFFSPNSHNMSIPDAYKKALKLQSEVLDVRTLLQEEMLRREGAETNVECMKMEYEKKEMEMTDRIQELGKEVEERVNDLDDGVIIVKGLEEELEVMTEQYSKAESKVKELQEQLYECKTFEKEKKILEGQCEDFELEVKEMKVRVREIEAKRQMIDEQEKQFQEMGCKLESMTEGHKVELNRIEREHQERISAYEQSLDVKVVEVKNLQEKIVAMEKIVTMYHEKARSEVKEFAQQVDNAKQHEAEAREELHEALKQIQDHEDASEQLENEIVEIRDQLDLKEVKLKEANEKVLELSKKAKTQNVMNSKEQQYMREKKKWITMEKNLRKDLRESTEKLINLELNDVVLTDENKELMDLIDEVERANEELEEESNTFKERLQAFEEESSIRINTLEQKLYRLQKSSPVKEKVEVRYNDGHIFMQEENVMREIGAFQQSNKRELRVETNNINQNREFKFEESDDEDAGLSIDNQSRASKPTKVKPRQDELMVSPRDVVWRDTDGASMTSSKKSKDRDRKSIENDAIRKYMRHRRRTPR